MHGHASYEYQKVEMDSALIDVVYFQVPQMHWLQCTSCWTFWLYPTRSFESDAKIILPFWLKGQTLIASTQITDSKW